MFMDNGLTFVHLENTAKDSIEKLLLFIEQVFLFMSGRSVSVVQELFDALRVHLVEEATVPI